MTRSGGATIEPEQRAAARVVGFLYVFTMATAPSAPRSSWCYRTRGLPVGLANMMPLGLYEVGLGIWLLVRGIRTPVVAVGANLPAPDNLDCTPREET